MPQKVSWKMLDTFKVLTCAATYHEFIELHYLESSWLCIAWEIIETQSLHLKQSISKTITRTKRKWIFGEASALKEGFDQHMGGHISLHGHDFYEISDNYKNKNENNGSSEFITFYNIRNPFNPHLYFTIIPCSLFVPILTALECAASWSFSTIFFLRIIIRKNISNISLFHNVLLHSSQYFHQGHARNLCLYRREGLSSNTGINFLH